MSRHTKEWLIVRFSKIFNQGQLENGSFDFFWKTLILQQYAPNGLFLCLNVLFCSKGLFPATNLVFLYTLFQHSFNSFQKTTCQNFLKFWYKLANYMGSLNSVNVRTTSCLAKSLVSIEFLPFCFCSTMSYNFI